MNQTKTSTLQKVSAYLALISALLTTAALAAILCILRPDVYVGGTQALFFGGFLLLGLGGTTLFGAIALLVKGEPSSRRLAIKAILLGWVPSALLFVLSPILS